MAKAWEPDLQDVKDVFLKNRGNVAASAKNMNVGRDVLFRYINKHPELKESLEEARSIQSEDELELAVSLNYIFMQDYKNNPSLASQHVRFTLEKKGSIRGYQRDAQIEPDKANNQEAIDLKHEVMLLKHQLQQLRDNVQSS